MGEEIPAASTNLASSIPLPPPLILTKGNAAFNWRRFKRQWENYEAATLLSSQPATRRAAILLSCIGTDAYDIFRSMAFAADDDRQDVGKIIEAFDNFCIGEINVSYERYVLNKRIQEPNESFDTFLSDVRRLVKSCDYGAIEDSIVREICTYSESLANEIPFVNIQLRATCQSDYASVVVGNTVVSG